MLDSVLLNTGGLFLPKPIPQPGFGVVAIIWLLALVAIPFVLRFAAQAARADRPAGQTCRSSWASWR